MTVASFKRILADLDPRTDGQPAFDRVRQIAVASGADVELFICDSLEHSIGNDLSNQKRIEESRAEYMASLESWLEKQAAELTEAGVANVGTSIAWHAPRYEAILEKAEDCDADLIIRSAKAHSKLERLLISATDWELIRRAPRTIWLVKKKPASVQAAIDVLAAVDPVHAQEKKIGLDQRILQTAAQISGLSKGALHAFHAWQPGATIAPAIAAGPHVPAPVVRVDAGLIESIRQERSRMLNDLVSSFEISPENRHLREGSVTGELDALIHELNIDAVVAGGVSRGRLERLVIGSTAEAILESVDCDVVVVKPDHSEEG